MTTGNIQGKNLKRGLLLVMALCLALALLTAAPARAADSGQCRDQAWIQLPSDDILAFLSSDYDQTIAPSVAIAENYAVIVWPTVNSGGTSKYQAAVGQVMTDDLGTFVWFNTNKVHSVPVSAAVSRPSVAINDGGQVILAFEAPRQSISYQACRVAGSGDSLGLDCGQVHPEIAHGQDPSVALFKNGGAVIVYENSVFQELWYRAGSFNAGGLAVDWGGDDYYDSGANPYVAVDQGGDSVVEVHHASADVLYPHKLFIKVGKHHAGAKTISWGGSQGYESDGNSRPTVAVSGGTVIEFHQAHSHQRTYYRFGAYNGDSVSWQGGSDRRCWGSGDDGDSLPCVAASRDGKLLMSFLNPTTSPYTMVFGGIGAMGYDHVCPWPTVTTSPVSNITPTAAVSGGKVTPPGYSPVTARGVCWSTSPNPTVSDDSHTSDGAGVGSFISHLGNLMPQTGYWLRAYATNSQGAGYGDSVYFHTGQGAPTALTFLPWFVTSDAALAAGAVLHGGGVEVRDRGLCWSTLPNPTIDGDHMSAGSGLGGFEEFITGLTPDATYYLRAYGSNEYGVGYGANLTFKTLHPSLATVYTADPLGITASSATLGGEVASQGSDPVFERGVVWDTAPMPNLNNQRVPMGSGAGEFSQNLTGLADETTYYLRAYAINDSGHSFGQEKIFTASSDALPRVITTAPYGETATSALSGGYVTNSGQSPVTARGVCWSTAPKPDLSGPHSQDGQGMGGFHSVLSGLAQETAYYVRAYATNGAGTSYGEEYYFNSPHPAAPTVQTLALSDLSADSVQVGGEVVTQGGGPVTARGVCWSTAPHPRLRDNVVNAGAGLGQFSATIGGLQAETVYYARAFASNDYGTAYGHVVRFRTTFCPYPCR